MQSIIIFASGRGSNAKAIIDHFKQQTGVSVSLVVSNRPDAGVLDIAQAEGIPAIVVDRNKFNDEKFVSELSAYHPSIIILAGFLWKIPAALVSAFPDRIINIHPALLPNYGGKGMYGNYVHEAVLKAGEAESGITIHYVNEVYDSGDIILQARCKILPGDNAEGLASRIHQLEHFYYPRVIEFLLSSRAL